MEDPLNINIDLQGVDTALPTLPEQDYTLQVSESVIQPNKDRTGHNWHLKIVTVDAIVAVDGREVKPDFPVFIDVALQPKEDSTDPTAFRRGIASTIDALFGTTKENRPAFNQTLVASSIGRKVVAHIYPDEWPKGSGQMNNKVRRLKVCREGA